MKRDFLLAIASVLAFAGLATANDISAISVSNAVFAEHQVQRIDSLEAELASLRTMGGSDKGKGGKGGYGDCCYEGGVYANIELVLLKPHISALEITEFGGDPVQLTPEHDYTASPRFTLGYMNCEGLGVRARYWTFDSNATQVVDTLQSEVTTGVDVRSLDLDVTQMVTVCGVNLNFFGGIKYGKIGDNIVITQGDFVQVAEEEFEGFGPTVGLDFRRSVGCRGLAMVGGLRGSWLFGQTDLLDTDNQVIIRGEDTMTQVWEAYIGTEYTRCVGNGVFVARAVWEAQAWEIAPVAEGLLNNPLRGVTSQDIGFNGPSFSLGFLY